MERTTTRELALVETIAQRLAEIYEKGRKIGRSADAWAELDDHGREWCRDRARRLIARVREYDSAGSIPGFAYYDEVSGRGAFLEHGRELEQLTEALDDEGDDVHVGPPQRARLQLLGPVS
jgi:hypothetical protein